MVSHCANPACREPFRFLHSGRIFRFDIHHDGVGQDLLWEDYGMNVEHFWLCENCAQLYTLERSTGEVRLRRIRMEPGTAV